MKMRRNMPSTAAPLDSSCPSCYYDEIFGTAQAVAAGGNSTITLAPETAAYFCPQFVDTVIMDAAAAETNSRALLVDVEIRNCSQLAQNSAQATTSAGIVIPDMMSRSAECCLGTPVCWGAFGQTGLSAQLLMFLVNLSAAFAQDQYIRVVGQLRDQLNGSWKVGKCMAPPR